MKILVDSREKPAAIRQILATFGRRGIEYEIRALPVGDYMEEGKPGLGIDRKRTLSELAQNLLSPDRARFYREVKRARASGVRLIILCEHGHGIANIQDVGKWRNPYGRVTGTGLREAIYRCAIGYGVEFLFCERRQTGNRIIELLTGEGNDGGLGKGGAAGAGTGEPGPDRADPQAGIP